MNYDITFCSNTNCDKDCERNLKNTNEVEVLIRGGISVSEFKECEYFKDLKEEK